MKSINHANQTTKLNNRVSEESMRLASTGSCSLTITTIAILSLIMQPVEQLGCIDRMRNARQGLEPILLPENKVIRSGQSLRGRIFADRDRTG
jgi:hypothetical protein